MKPRSNIIIGQILFLILRALAICADNVQQGTYAPSVILTAPWGEKNLFDHNVPSEPGKFGFGLNAESLAVGPTAFTIAPNGDIYIGDALNDRVQRFSAQGNFIKVIPKAWGSFYAGLAVDKDGNIYSPDTYTSNPKVYKFDQNGNQVMIYPIVKDEEMGTDKPYKWGGGGPIHCDDSNRVFIEYDQGVFQIGTKDLAFSVSQQKATFKKANFGATANVPNMNKVLHEIGLLGVDRDAVYTMQKDEKNPNVSIIKKSTYGGNLVATYTLDGSQVNCQLITSFSMNMRTVFDEGNIYVFCSDKDGIKIIKWSPVEGVK